LVPDLPGFKETPPQKPWSVNDYLEWVKEYVDKLSKVQGRSIEPFFLLGHSFGGRLAIKFATLYPQKILGLILVDSAGVGKEKTFRQKIILKLAKFGHFIIALPLLGRLIFPFFQKLAYFLAGTKDYYLIKNQVMKETFKKVIAEDLTSYLDKIKVPTLIIWGKKDKIVPAKIGYLIKEKMPLAKLEILSGVGHNPHLEAPQILAEKILNFVK
jgi:pimeloyl-ACP methyl ester carboxylesterase